MAALRGFALFGIFLVNLMGFTFYGVISNEQRAAIVTASTDLPIGFTILWLAYGKFNTIFSFRFGLGFSLLLLKEHQRSIDFVRFYRRRLAVLLAIGLVASVSRRILVSPSRFQRALGMFLIGHHADRKTADPHATKQHPVGLGLSEDRTSSDAERAGRVGPTRPAERFEQYCPHPAEHRDIGADPETKRHNHGKRDQGCTGQRAKGVAQVLAHGGV